MVEILERMTMNGANVREMIAGTYGEGKLHTKVSYWGGTGSATSKRGEINGFGIHKEVPESHVVLQIKNTERTTIHGRKIAKKTDFLQLPQDGEIAQVTILPEDTIVEWEKVQRGGKLTEYVLIVPTF